MKAAVWEGPREQIIKDVPIPELGPGEVLVKVKDIGICGSDLHNATDKNPNVRPPMILGHELSGTVQEFGPDIPEDTPVIGTKVGLLPLVYCGTCSACMAGLHNLCANFKLLGHQIPGGFAEYIKVNCDRLLPVPESINFDNAYMLEPLAVVVHAFSHIEVKPGDEVVILGGGPIGMLCAEMARIKGATNIIVTDIADFRLEVIRKMGYTAVNAAADNVNDVILKNLDGAGADLVIEAVGAGPTALQTAYISKIGGQILIVGMQKGPVSIDLREMAFGEQKLQSARLYKDEDFVRAAKLLEADLINVSFFGNIRMALEKVNEAFDIMRKADSSLKVVIDLSL